MLENITAIAVAALTLLAAVFRTRSTRRDKRTAIIKDLDLLSKLPDASEVRDRLSEHIDARIGSLIDDEGLKRRNPAGIAAGIIFLTFAAWLGWFGLTHRDSLPFLFGFALMIGVFGLVELDASVRRRVRDDGGHPVSQQEPPTPDGDGAATATAGQRRGRDRGPDPGWRGRDRGPDPGRRP